MDILWNIGNDSFGYCGITNCEKLQRSCRLSSGAQLLLSLAPDVSSPICALWSSSGAQQADHDVIQPDLTQFCFSKPLFVLMVSLFLPPQMIGAQIFWMISLIHQVSSRDSQHFRDTQSLCTTLFGNPPSSSCLHSRWSTWSVLDGC